MRTVLILMVMWLATVPAPAMAGSVIWRCEFPENRASSGGWVSGSVAVQIEEGASEALVNSGVIMHFVGKPITAMVLTDKADQLVLKWEVMTSVKGGGAPQYTRMKYKLNVLKGKSAAVYFAQPLSFDNTWRNNGTCQLLQR